MLRKMTVRDYPVDGKRALIRVDFNVPLDRQTGAAADDTRLRASLPTLRYLLRRGCALVLCSHLGRPNGSVVEALRMAPVATRLERLLRRPVLVARDCVGAAVERQSAALQPGQVLLLENLRFHPEEEENDPRFSRMLARHGEVFVNDAFGTAHRAHASTVGVAAYLPAVAGLLMAREVRFLDMVVSHPRRPVALMLGGAKISDKIGVLRHLLPKLTVACLGGGMANTFWKARGIEVGASLTEDDQIGVARAIDAEAPRYGARVELPVDAVVAREAVAGAEHRIVTVAEGVPPGWKALDIGPASVERFQRALAGARTVVWNGPLGVFEVPPFDAGTLAMARVVAGLDALTFAGGGDTVAALERTGLVGRITHVSTGGGASLECLEGKTLPGVAALLDKPGRRTARGA